MPKKIILAVGIIVVLAALGRGFQGESEPVIKEIEPFAYCALEHTGPLSDIGAVIGRLIEEMQGQNVFSAIRGPMVGVYPLDAMTANPEDLAWEVGFIVTAQAEPLAPLVKKVWDFPTVAAIVHVGPYQNVGGTIERLMAWMKDQGCVAGGPLMERYLNNPMQVKPEELRTEIWIPCDKE
jgi:effector-binding domain-containing protein